MTAGSESGSESDQQRWGILGCIGFRFIFTYFVLHSIVYVLSFIPLLDQIALAITTAEHTVVPLVGKHMLHLSEPLSKTATNSSDTAFDWMVSLCKLVLSLAITLVWSVLDWKRQNYKALSPWFRVLLRLFLGSEMIGYGALKVIPVQFPAPSLLDLMQTYGESSPLRLLWNFMGFSRAYTAFTGVAEMVGGILLFFPRLTTLGALVCFAVMLNVFMLNLNYDVALKRESFHLLLICLILIAPEFGRLFKFLVLNAKVEKAKNRQLFRDRRLNQLVFWLQIAFGLHVTYWYLSQYYAQEKLETVEPKQNLHGIWIVEDFSVDDQPVCGKDRWQRIIIEGRSIVRTADGIDSYFELQDDPDKKQLLLNSVGTTNVGKFEVNTKSQGKFNYDRSSPDQMTITGQLGAHKTTAKLHRLDESKFVLNSRGFHWVTDIPFSE